MSPIRRYPRRERNESTGSYRCTTCALDWPLIPDERFRPPLPTDYRICASCGEACDRETAYRVRLHMEFERFYERRGDQLECEAA